MVVFYLKMIQTVIKYAHFNYYYDENKNKYICTEDLKCPEPYDKLIYGKNECIKSCTETGLYNFELVLGKVCLTNCSENFYEPYDRPFSCLPKCSKDKPFLLFESLECVSYCTIKQRQNKLCVTYYIYSKEDNYEIFNEVISQTRNELLNNFDASVVNGGIINENGDNITIGRTQKENINSDDLYLGECEERLIEKYNIPPNETLYILRLDVNQLGMRTPSLEYEILYPINDNKNLVKLDLSICSGLKIERTLNINITGNIDKYYKTSPYYNDICYIADSDYGTDITLKDRKEDYIDNNMGICEDKCDFISYNYETQKAVCSCNIKTEIPLINNIKIDKDALLKSFIDINNIANIQMLKCYKIVFKKNNILKNIGCFIYVCLIIFNLVCLLCFLIKDYKILASKIYKLKLYFLNNKKVNKNAPHKTFRIKKEHINNKSSEKKININNIYNIKKVNVKMKINKIHSPLRKYLNHNNHFNNKLMNNKQNKSKENINRNHSIKILNNHHLVNNIKNIHVKNPKILGLNFNEFNHLTFNDAITKDKRNFCQYYLSLLETNHFILYIFYSKDYNSKAIKVSIFIFNITSSIAINALFFNDSTMHKIYAEHGEFDFLYQLPQIIYSTIISTVFDFLINLLGLSEESVLKMKNANILIKDVVSKFNILFRVLKIKFALFFIINFILLLFFWYYVTRFLVYIEIHKYIYLKIFYLVLLLLLLHHFLCIYFLEYLEYVL